MRSTSVLAIPSALIQCSGLADLTRLEFKLWWKLIGFIQNDRAIQTTSKGIVLKVPAKELIEAGEEDRRGLLKRLNKLSTITLEANLDNRDNNANLWRIGLKLVSEYEVISSSPDIEINIGSRFYEAVRDHNTFARIKSAALFEMTGCKYASRIYALIRDKINQDYQQWVISYDNLRMLLQVKQGTYDKFSDFRVRVLDAAVAEVNQLSELDVSWRKSLTFKNQVREITFEWSLKPIEVARKVDRALSYSRISRGKSQDTVYVQSDNVRQALRYLEGADIYTRIEWAKRYVELGFGPETPAMTHTDNLKLWVDERIAALMSSEDTL